MREFYRLLATGVIWVALMVMLGLLFVFGTGPTSTLYGDAVFGIVLVTSVAAAASTYAVWESAYPASADQADAGSAAQKAKRLDRSRLQRLIETMDDDEIIELETLLTAREADQFP